MNAKEQVTVVVVGLIILLLGFVVVLASPSPDKDDMDTTNDITADIASLQYASEHVTVTIKNDGLVPISDATAVAFSPYHHTSGKCASVYVLPTWTDINIEPGESATFDNFSSACLSDEQKSYLAGLFIHKKSGIGSGKGITMTILDAPTPNTKVFLLVPNPDLEFPVTDACQLYQIDGHSPDIVRDGSAVPASHTSPRFTAQHGSEPTYSITYSKVTIWCMSDLDYYWQLQ